MTISSSAWQSAGFNVFIDGVRSTYTDIVPTGQNTFAFNLTRACNLSVGSHQVLIRFTDVSSGTTRPQVVTERSNAFTVIDNRWPGVASNNTNRCGAGLGVTLASITSRAPGESDQLVTNVAAGSTGRFVGRAGVTYTYRGVAVDPLVYAEEVSGRFGGDFPIEGNPTAINGRAAYFGVFFERGNCARTAGQDVATQGGNTLLSQTMRVYFQSLVQ